MNWDGYYLGICKTVAENSKCLSRKIGAILVYDKSIISTGYNGPPRGVRDCSKGTGMYFHESNPVSTKCPRLRRGYGSGEGLEWCIAGHAERNSLINAARHGIKTKGSIMYMSCGIPCIPCLIEIINAGVVEIVCTETTTYDKEPSVTKYLLNNCDLKIRVYDELQ